VRRVRSSKFVGWSSSFTWYALIYSSVLRYLYMLLQANPTLCLKQRLLRIAMAHPGGCDSLCRQRQSSFIT
jgi:hypothetical protein